MVRLKDIAKVIRSKNAGPWHVTFDVMFDDKETYEKVKRRKILSSEVIAGLYGVREQDVLFTEYDVAYSFKATIPRSVPCGHPEDRDTYAAQQHMPLMDLTVEE